MMSKFKVAEIQRIIKLTKFDSLVVEKDSSEIDSPIMLSIRHALNMAGIGIFAWSMKKNSVYISDISLEYLGIERDSEIKYLDALKRIFDEDNLYRYFVALETIYSGENMELNIELPIYSHLHQSSKFIRFTFNREDTDNDVIISGTAQDMTLLRESISELAESEHVLSQVIDAVPMPVFYVNNKNRIENGNKAVDAVLGLDFNEWRDVEISEYYDFVQSYFQISGKKTIHKDEFHSTYEISVVKDNEPMELLIDEVQIFDKKGNKTGRIFVHTDITNRIRDIKMVKKLLKANELLVRIGDMVDAKVNSHDLYQTILKGLTEIISNSEKGCILHLDYDNNIYIIESIGYDEAYAKTFRIPFEDSFAKAFLNGNYRQSVCITDIQETYGDVFPDIKNELRGFKLESNITAPISVDGNLHGLISIDSSQKGGFDDIDLNLIDFMRAKIELSINRFKDISEAVEKSQKDELTGAYNRYYLNSVTESLINEAILHHKGFCLVVMDLDGLKKVNDTFGHQTGDILIKNFTMVLTEHVREEDVIARIGGDEFVGIFRSGNSGSLKNKMDEIAQVLIDEPLILEQAVIKTEFSFGISLFPTDGEDLDKLISVADERMYRQKVSKKIDKLNG